MWRRKVNSNFLSTFRTTTFRNCKSFLHRCLAFQQGEKPGAPTLLSEPDLEPGIHFSSIGFATALCKVSSLEACGFNCGSRKATAEHKKHVGGATKDAVISSRPRELAVPVNHGAAGSH